MYSDADLEAAVVSGALTAEQATRFRQHVAQSRLTPAVDEEHFRLLTGFNDIFVAIAAIILLMAMGWIGNALPPQIEEGGPSPFIGLLVAMTAWGLAEYFTRRRRMALPSIILLLAFVGGVIAASGFAFVALVGPDTLRDDPSLGSMILAGAAAVGAVAAWGHWKRFHVPITVAAGAAAAAGLVVAILVGMIGPAGHSETVVMTAVLLLGIVVSLFAMQWDSSDRARETRRSDVAFWLHLLAAPMIVHPIFTLLGLNDGSVGIGEALIVVLVYLLLGVTALAIDRRALLVSALAYVLFALDSLFRAYGAVELSIAFTALVIGSALLLLSAFWTHARRAVVSPLPEALKLRLPSTQPLLSAA